MSMSSKLASIQQTVFSECRRYRYTLWREWSFDAQRAGFVMFIGLNPSTADEVQNDPTVRRCIDFAKRWGFGAMSMMNAFAYRATDPAEMKRQPEPVGEDNDFWLRRCAECATRIVLAWGLNGAHAGRDGQVLELLARKKVLAKVVCLRITQGGHPEHPLYMPADVEPVTEVLGRLKHHENLWKVY